MNITIRGRLTVWYTLAFCAALVLVVGMLALELNHLLNAQTRRALFTEETWITLMGENGFSHPPTAQETGYDSLISHLNHEMDRRYGLKRQFVLMTIDAIPGKVYFSGGVRKVAQHLPADLLEWQPGNYTMTIVEDHFRVRVFRRDWGTVAVGVENETIFEVAEEAGEILIWIMPLAILIAITGGWFMAKLALRPVLATARTAESISLANLKERLPTYAGKDEFGALVATLNRMIARLEDGVRRLQRFTQDAAHELRTPLTVLRGDLELAYQEKDTPEDMRVWLQKNLDRLIALNEIVDNLIILTRSDSGDYPINKTSFRLDVVVKEIYEDLQILAEGGSVAVHLHVDGAVDFYGDEALIRHMLLNLCDNALKHTSQGSIKLSLKTVDSKIQLAISDTGDGIPAEDLPHIFDRFYRVDKARSSDSGGSGLGLAICQWIALSHGGTIDVSSEVGKSTTVLVSLPNAQEPIGV